MIRNWRCSSSSTSGIRPTRTTSHPPRVRSSPSSSLSDWSIKRWCCGSYSAEESNSGSCTYKQTTGPRDAASTRGQWSWILRSRLNHTIRIFCPSPKVRLAAQKPIRVPRFNRRQLAPVTPPTTGRAPRVRSLPPKLRLQLPELQSARR